MARILLKELRKSYDDTEAVRGIDLDIAHNEFVVLVGPSGCGKSTTLRMIAGLEEIPAGDIIIGEDVVNHIPPKDRDIAMVFQNYALYPHMTVYQNMSFGLRLRKTNREEIDTRVREAADILNIGELLDRRPKQLSGGMPPGAPTSLLTINQLGSLRLPSSGPIALPCSTVALTS